MCKEMVLGAGCQGQKFLSYIWGGTGWAHWLAKRSEHCLIMGPVVPLHWHCSVSEAVLLLLPPVSGPFGILFPNTDSLTVEKLALHEEMWKKGMIYKHSDQLTRQTLVLFHFICIEREEISSPLILWKGDDRTWREKKTRRKAKKKSCGINAKRQITGISIWTSWGKI